MKRVLITGGAGFIGFHLSKELYSHGYSIDIIDNFSRGANDKELKTLTASDKVNVFNADLLNPKELDKFSDNYDYIYHLAAMHAPPYRRLSDRGQQLTWSTPRMPKASCPRAHACAWH